MDFQEIIDLGRGQVKTGKVADYIPELASKDPGLVACGIMDEHGQLRTAGDVDCVFSLQSITKVFALCMALECHGEERVREYCGMQSSAKAFNTLEGLDELPFKAPNPMLNSGAITMTGLLGENVAEQMILRMRSWTGYENFFLDDAVGKSEEATGFRNMAIGYLLKSRGRIDGNPIEVLHEYFYQCAISTDISGLTTLAGWFAKGCPGLKEDKIERKRIYRLTMAMMLTGGLYDGTTAFIADIGLPAKSGVGGGILAFEPGGRGYGVFGTALDSRGNSAAGLAMLGAMVQRREE